MPTYPLPTPPFSVQPSGAHFVVLDANGKQQGGTFDDLRPAQLQAAILNHHTAQQAAQAAQASGAGAGAGSGATGAGLPPIPPPPPPMVAPPPPPPPPPPPQFAAQAQASSASPYSAFGPAYAGLGVTPGGQAMPPPPPPQFAAPTGYSQVAPSAFPPGMQPAASQWANMTAPQGPWSSAPPARPLPMPIGSTHGPGFAGQFSQNFRTALPQSMMYGQGALSAAKSAGASALIAAHPGVAAAAAVAVAMKAAAKGVHDFAEHITDANRELAQYSGAVQNAYMRLSLGDMNRSMRVSREMEDPAAALAGFTNQMRDALMPLRLAGERAATEGGSLFGGAVQGGANFLKPMFDTFNGVMKAVDPNGDRANSIGQVIGYAVTAAITGPLTAIAMPLLGSLNRAMGWESSGGDAVDAGGPWSAMILTEAGPGRTQPVLPVVTVNLGGP